MKLAIKIGGSMAIGEHGFKPEYIDKLIPVINKVKQKTEKFILGIGGGKFVRNYYTSIRKFLSEDQMEWLGIDLLKANARFLAYVFNGKPVFDMGNIPDSNVLVIAGIEPGRSTDANTALLAEKFHADIFIILTDVDGIYDKDPDKYSDAVLFDKIKFDELEKFIQKKTGPGDYGVIDPLALKVIKRSKVHTFTINGNKPENILKILQGKKIGTEICES